MLVVRLAQWQIDALREGEAIVGRYGEMGDDLALHTQAIRVEPPGTPGAQASGIPADRLNTVDPRVAEGRLPPGPRPGLAQSAPNVAAMREAAVASGARGAEEFTQLRQALGHSAPDPQSAGWAVQHPTPAAARARAQTNTLHLHVHVGPYVLGSLTRLAERLQVDLPDVLEEVLVMGCEALEAGL